MITHDLEAMNFIYLAHCTTAENLIGILKDKFIHTIIGLLLKDPGIDSKEIEEAFDIIKKDQIGVYCNLIHKNCIKRTITYFYGEVTLLLSCALLNNTNYHINSLDSLGRIVPSESVDDYNLYRSGSEDYSEDLKEPSNIASYTPTNIELYNEYLNNNEEVCHDVSEAVFYDSIPIKAIRSILVKSKREYNNMVELLLINNLSEYISLLRVKKKYPNKKYIDGDFRISSDVEDIYCTLIGYLTPQAVKHNITLSQNCGLEDSEIMEIIDFDTTIEESATLDEARDKLNKINNLINEKYKEYQRGKYGIGPRPKTKKQHYFPINMD